MSGRRERRSWRERHPNVQLPWQAEGWYTDEVRAAEDPAIEAVVQASRRGRIDPRGSRSLHPRAMIHSPYLALLYVAAVLAGGLFLIVTVPDATFAWWMAGFMWFFGLMGLAIAVWRIPGWHRARAAVRRHIAEHGGEMPENLQWYS
ncbi:hypothetical protein [Agromyces soli]|uniref:Uncharacterized protein n=1 Tax=Agromyces soli TaxID=659012 RepID=A0ABY4AWJ2_9MICO|nr:hypothetical protein [Agromyces soli]UOE27538.1 hypothetical protein MTP13_07100 [Agromyces soli]